MKKTDTEDLVARAEAGDARAAQAMGLLMEIGLEDKPDIKGARKFYEIAAKQGDPLAQLSVVNIVKTGADGTQPDLKAASALLKQFEKDAMSKATVRPTIQVDPNMKVLVADASEDDRHTLHETLKANGFKVIEAKSGVEALSIVKMNPDIKMIFTEVSLTEMDGVQFIEKLRLLKQFETLPVVFLTGSKQPELITRAKRAGIHGWLLKPMNEELVIKSTDRWVRNKVSA